MHFDISEEFKAAFNLALSHYECSREEAKYEKERIMRSAVDYYIAERCYLAIAEEIKQGKI